MARVGVLLQGKYEIAQSTQIGEGGMMIKPNQPLKEGDLLVVSFMVPHRGFIIVRARVQYLMKEAITNKNQYGLQFLNISFEYRRMLRDFISAKTEEEALQEGLFRT